MNPSFCRQLTLLFTLLASLPALGQTDTSFWFVAPDCAYPTSPNVNLESPIRLRFTAQNLPANITVTQPANPAFTPMTLPLAANAVGTIDLTSRITDVENRPGNQVLNKGLLIQATNMITVYYEQGSQLNPDIFSLKGRTALGTSFMIPMQNVWQNNPAYLNPSPTNAFDLVATTNNTQVTITPSQGIVGRPAGVPFTITLQRGQTYSAVATGFTGVTHLSGSTVTSDKPIAITIKDDLLSNASIGTCADLAGDQLIPIHVLGTKYIAIHGFLNGTNDQVFITGTQNGTQVRINGTLIGTINAGQTISRSSNGAPQYIETSLPTAIFHVSGFGCEVGGAVLPSIECTGSRQIAVTRSDNTPIFLILVVATGGETGFTLNGNAIAANQFLDVPSTAGAWKYARLDVSSQVPVGQSAFVVNTTRDFHLGIIHGDAGGGCRYAYFSDFQTLQATAAANTPLCTGNTLNLTCPASNTNGVTFQWSGPNGFTANTQSVSIPNITAAQAGTYTCTVTKQNCVTVNTSVTVVVNPAPVITASNNSPLCTGGTAIFNSTSTIQPANFSWTGPNGYTSTSPNPVIQNVQTSQAGTYTVTATANGCTSAPQNVTLVVNPTNSITASNGGPYCAGQTIQLNAVTSGGNVSWTGPNGFVAAGASVGIPNATLGRAGVYTATVTGGGCAAASASTTVAINDTPRVVATSNSPICSGANLQFQATSSIPGTIFSWIGPNGFTSNSPTPIITNPTTSNAGAYSVFGTVNGCSSSSQTLLVAIGTANQANASNTGPYCIGDAISLSAGTNSGTIVWTGPNGFSATGSSVSIPNAQLSSSGVYTVQVTGGGCTPATSSTTVVVSSPPQLVLAPVIPLCAGSSLSLQATANPASALIGWSGPGGFTATTANPIRPNVATNQSGYYVASANLSGCVRRDSVLVVVNPTPSASITNTGDANLCTGTSLQLAVTNSLTPISYSWTGPNGFTASTANITRANMQLIDSGRYFVTVTHLNCSAMDSIQVRVRQSPNVIINPVSPLCSNEQPITLAASETTGLTGVGTWSGTGVNSGGQFNPAQAGIGNITVQYTFVAANACGTSTTRTIVVNPTPVVDAGPNQVITGAAPALLNGTSSVASSLVVWTPPNGLDNPFSLTTPANPDSTTVYYLEVTTDAGCSDFDSVRVLVIPAVFIPNSFTPNNDGKNDQWRIPALIAYPNCEVEIFNRYGQKVFYSRGYSTPWDGTYQRQAQPVGNYVYVIRLNNGRQLQPYSGNLLLLR